MKIKLSLCIWCFLGFKLLAQTTLTSFQEARESIVLLKNDQDIIPLSRLESLRAACYPFAADGNMSTSLNRYTVVKTTTDLAEAKNYNCFIIAIDKANRAKQTLLLEQIPSKSLLISILVGEADNWIEEPIFKASQAVFYLPKPQTLAFEIIPQIIFGGLGSIGRLDRDMGMNPDVYVKGLGVQTKGGMRLSYVPPAFVGMNGQYLNDSLRTIVQEGIDKGAYPGAQVLVAKDGKVIFFETFGYHTYQKERAVRETDMYDFASVTKVTSALAAIMKLHGEGKFDLNASFPTYWPDMKKSNKADLTFRSMLSHNARLMPWIPYWRSTLRKNANYPWKNKWNNTILNDYKFKRKTFKRDSSTKYTIRITDDLWLHRDYKKKIYKAIRKSPLNEKEGYVYSGLLFYLLPEIVANLTGENYEAYLRKHFYEPLGANTIGYNPYKRFDLNRIVPTERDTFFRMQQLHGTVHDEGAAMMAGVSANAGLFGTANDLAKLFQMYQNGGVYAGKQYIAANSLKEFTSRSYEKEGNRRGLGFDKPLITYDYMKSYIAKSASSSSFGHSGYTGTLVWSDPDTGILFIFFSNRVFPTRDNRKLYIHNLRPRMHQAVYDAIQKEEE